MLSQFRKIPNHFHKLPVSTDVTFKATRPIPAQHVDSYADDKQRAKVLFRIDDVEKDRKRTHLKRVP